MNGKILTVTLNPAIDISAKVEQLEPDIKLRCQSARYEPGGGGINVARVIKELGGDVCAFMVVGGVTGRWLASMLADADISVLPHEVDGVTRPSIHITEELTGKLYRFVLPGPCIAASDARSIPRSLAQALDTSSYGHVVVSGSQPTGMPKEFFREFASVCRKRGARLVVDTSGMGLSSCLGADLFLVKPDRQEVESLKKEQGWTHLSITAAARKLVENKTAENIAVTLGADGAILVTRDEDVHLPAVPVRKVSPIGAGDSFVAGLVFALSKEKPLHDALRLGLAAGAAAVMTPGTALARRGDIERLYASLKSARQ